MAVKKCIQAVLGLAVVAAAYGCSSSSSSSSGPDFTALQAQYSSPTGKLSGKSDVTSAASQYSKSQSEGGGIMSLGGLDTKLGQTMGVKLQGPVSFTGDISEPCGEGASGGGGTFDITGLATSGTSEQATIDFTNCNEGNGSDTINGTMSFDEISATELIYAGSVTVTPPHGASETVDLNFEIDNGQFAFSATIASGNVVVAAADGDWDSTNNTGSFTVKDSQGTWNCTVMTNSGKCTGPGQDITWN